MIQFVMTSLVRNGVPRSGVPGNTLAIIGVIMDR